LKDAFHDGVVEVEERSASCAHRHGCGTGYSYGLFPSQ